MIIMIMHPICRKDRERGLMLEKNVANKVTKSMEERYYHANSKRQVMHSKTLPI